MERPQLVRNINLPVFQFLNMTEKNVSTTEYSRWLKKTLIVLALAFVVIISYIAIVDPFFHYHGPLSQISYALDNERYQNDGITRHFDYDTIITGTSLTENFLPSECDELYGGKTIKVALQGATFKEVNDGLVRAFRYNPDIRTVIRCLDMKNFQQDWDYISYDGLPTYLYDDNLLNDTGYVLNKSVVIATNEQVRRTLEGKPGDTMDTYMFWGEDFDYGPKKVKSTYVRPDQEEPRGPITEEEKEAILKNVRENITSLPAAHPETTFYYYLSPDSICWWDVEANRAGKLEYYFELQELVIEEILKTPNIKLFSYSSRFDVIEDLGHYKDLSHYDAGISHRILKWMKEDRGRLTQDNYKNYIEEIREFYTDYDYDYLYT